MASYELSAPSATETLHLSPTSPVNSDSPPISALFLINFDVKAGYTIIWKQHASGIELEGVVEYKSLPSGLHTVHDDLIYFVNKGHAGISAFINTPCEDEELRNACMISVGILVPLSYGRLGRAWRHAESLKELAEMLAHNRKETSILETYWQQHKVPGPSSAKQNHPIPESPLASPIAEVVLTRNHKRTRSTSDGGPLMSPGHKLSSFHPAWSLMPLLDTFGPLIFPIYRAALLRKRILISCHAPVHQICDFVYNISVLANIPLAVSEYLPQNTLTHRLRPLFAIGVHDIPYLQKHYASSMIQSSSNLPGHEENLGDGWIACTTDSILAMKDTLWDMLITMPSSHTPSGSPQADRAWPQVECPAGVIVKATQRDLRRFRALKLGLSRMGSNTSPPATPRTQSSFYMSAAEAHWEAVGIAPDAADKVVEPTTWAALAYSGFMWWASAGEQARTEEVEESAHDAALLTDLVRSQPSPRSHPTAKFSAAPLLPEQPASTATTTARSSLRQDLSAEAASGSMGNSLSSLMARRPSAEIHRGGDAGSDAAAARELAIIAYFHRLTTSILRVLAELNESANMADLREAYTDSIIEDEEEEDVSLSGLQQQEQQRLIRRLGTGEVAAEGAHEALDHLSKVQVDGEAIAAMGLDVWSAQDAVFIAAVVQRYFGRSTVVEGKGIEVCGFKVC